MVTSDLAFSHYFLRFLRIFGQNKKTVLLLIYYVKICRFTTQNESLIKLCHNLFALLYDTLTNKALLFDWRLYDTVPKLAGTVSYLFYDMDFLKSSHKKIYLNFICFFGTFSHEPLLKTLMDNNKSIKIDFQLIYNFNKS